MLVNNKRHMIKISKVLLKEIADYLDVGMRCFINKETGPLVTIPDSDSWVGFDEELWEDVTNELEENWDKYVDLPGMESHESFDLVADFTETINDEDLRTALINVLNKRHPFRNFKWVIDNSGPYRQKWFDFKNQRLIHWVKDQLDVLNIKYDNE